MILSNNLSSERSDEETRERRRLQKSPADDRVPVQLQPNLIAGLQLQQQRIVEELPVVIVVAVDVVAAVFVVVMSSARGAPAVSELEGDREFVTLDMYHCI